MNPFNLAEFQPTLDEIEKQNLEHPVPFESKLTSELKCAVQLLCADSSDQLSTENQNIIFLLKYITVIFEKRWQRIIDTPLDYTRNSEGINTGWIKLSQQLADLTHKTYLYYLMPSIEYASNTLSSRELADNKCLSKFILLNSGDQLARIDSLVNQWNETKTMVIQEAGIFKQSNVRALSLIELQRIYWSASGGTLNFSPEMRCEMMYKWQKNGDFPLIVIPMLLQLISHYTENTCLILATTYPSITTFLQATQGNFDAGFVRVINKEKDINSLFYIHKNLDICREILNCCSVLLPQLPHEDVTKISLGQYNAGYIRVINKEQKLNCLFYVNKEKNMRVPFDIEDAKLKEFDLKLRLTCSLTDVSFNDLPDLQKLLNEHVKLANQDKMFRSTIFFLDKTQSLSRDELAFIQSLTAHRHLDYHLEKFDSEYLATPKPRELDFNDFTKIKLLTGYQRPNRKRLMSNLTQTLKSMNQCDVYHLYGSTLTVNRDPNNPKNIFVSELLIKCMQDEVLDLKDEMIGLSLLLLKNDASQLSQNKLMQAYYSQLGVGNGMCFDILNQLIDHLKEDASMTIALQLSELAEMTQNETMEMIPLLEKIVGLFTSRWNDVKGTSSDYTRTPLDSEPNPNTWWIRTAQILIGAQLFNCNYIQLLMPTLAQDSHIFLGPYIDYPLSTYILNDEGTRLISLIASAKNCNQTKLFLNCSVEPFTNFTPSELERIAYADLRYQDYVSQYIQYEPKFILRSTVNRIFELVNGSLDMYGLEDRSSSDAISKAEGEWDRFNTFLERLPENEQENLLDQRTLLQVGSNHINFSVREILDNLRSVNKAGCVAVCGKYLAKLVMDYAPWLRFNNAIESSFLIATDHMRSQSAQKVFSDYDILTEDEASRRLNILMVSLLTHSFNSYDEKMLFLDLTNRGNKIVKPIFDKLLLCIKEKSPLPMSIRHTYVSIMEGIVEPLLKISPNVTCSGETKAWLTQINEPDYFSTVQHYSNPERLFLALCPLLENPIQESSTRILLDEILRTLRLPENESMKWVRVNVKLVEWIKAKNSVQKEAIITLIKNSGEVNQSRFFDAVYDFLSQRLVKSASALTNSQWLKSFFVTIQPRNSNLKQELLSLKPTDWSGFNSLQSVFSLIDKNVRQSSLTQNASLIAIIGACLR